MLRFCETTNFRGKSVIRSPRPLLSIKFSITEKLWNTEGFFYEKFRHSEPKIFVEIVMAPLMQWKYQCQNFSETQGSRQWKLLVLRDKKILTENGDTTPSPQSYSKTTSKPEVIWIQMLYFTEFFGTLRPQNINRNS